MLSRKTPKLLFPVVRPKVVVWYTYRIVLKLTCTSHRSAGKGQVSLLVCLSRRLVTIEPNCVYDEGSESTTGWWKQGWMGKWCQFCVILASTVSVCFVCLLLVGALTFTVVRGAISAPALTDVARVVVFLCIVGRGSQTAVGR